MRAENQERQGPVPGRLHDNWWVFISFTLLTYLFSWGIWTVMAAGVFPQSLDAILGRLGGFGPLVGALGVLWFSDWSVREWFTSNVTVRLPLRWYGYALLLPPLLVGAGGLVHATLFGETIGLESLPPFWVYPINLLIVFFIGGGQEELGWRGFALPAAQGQLSAFSSSLLVGVVWAGWHLPLFVLPNTPQGDLPFLPYLLAVVGLSVVLTWLYNGSGGSVLVAMLFHGGINPLGAYFPTGGVDAITTISGYSSYALVVVAFAAVLAIATGGTNLAGRSRVLLGDIVAR